MFMAKQINLVINGKGGVGKSFFATNFVQYLKDRAPAFAPGPLSAAPCASPPSSLSLGVVRHRLLHVVSRCPTLRFASS